MRARRLCPALLLLPLVVAALTAGAVLAQDGEGGEEQDAAAGSEGSGLGFSAPCLAHLQAYLASVLESPACGSCYATDLVAQKHPAPHCAKCRCVLRADETLRDGGG